VAAAAGRLIIPSRTLERGDVDDAWSRCDVVVSGRVDSGGQEHLYLETQGTVAIPLERGRIRLLSATQGPTAVQRITARVLGLPMNAIEVEVTRLGGAFGGKEDQATPWAVMAALAASKLTKPVKIVLARHEDMLMTGKRHPYSSDFRLGLRSDGTILAYQAVFHQNAGAAADLSPAILERSLFHSTASYSIPNVKITAHSCRTNLPPFTAMRGFGAPQAMFVIESAIAKAAESMAVDAIEIQRKNLLAEGDLFPYGMPDGSVSVSTAAVEMGQGVNTKIAGIAARTLGIPDERVRIESTDTTRVANTSPTAASSGADLNGRAAEIACETLRDRMKAVAADHFGVTPESISIVDGTVFVDGSETELGWQQLVWLVYTRRISLSAQAHYATPDIFYDHEQERGEPFAYHVYGAAVVEATVDCLRGIATIDRVGIVHDAGRSLNPLIDLGQIEGGLMQGVGWMTMEELLFDQGRLITGNLTTYKVPDILCTPAIDSVMLDDADNPAAVLSSKAIGEPPLMYGIGSYFAILNAIRAYRPDLECFFDAPLTSEKILMALHSPREIVGEDTRIEERAAVVE
jgi:xanthine dehydrogenase large subunit